MGQGFKRSRVKGNAPDETKAEGAAAAVGRGAVAARDSQVAGRLTDAGRLVLSLLGLDEDVFLKPPGSRKWPRVCHGMGEM
jgi:hypothetical protein